jgi:hypothetical protein
MYLSVRVLLCELGAIGDSGLIYPSADGRFKAGRKGRPSAKLGQARINASACRWRDSYPAAARSCSPTACR